MPLLHNATDAWFPLLHKSRNLTQHPQQNDACRLSSKNTYTP